jgi:hypothetical protein
MVLGYYMHWIVMGFFMTVLFCFMSYFWGRKFEYMTEKIYSHRTTTVNNIHIYGALSKEQVTKMTKELDLPVNRDHLTLGTSDTVDVELTQEEENDLELHFQENPKHDSHNLHPHRGVTRFREGEEKMGEENVVAKAPETTTLKHNTEVPLPQAKPQGEQQTPRSKPPESETIQVELGEQEFQMLEYMQQSEVPEKVQMKKENIVSPIIETRQNRKGIPEETQEVVKPISMEESEKMIRSWEVPEEYESFPTLSYLLEMKCEQAESVLGKVFERKEEKGKKYILFGDNYSRKWVEVTDTGYALPEKIEVIINVDLKEWKMVDQPFIFEPFTNKLVHFSTAA